MKKIDLNTWKRNEHFQHFGKFDESFCRNGFRIYLRVGKKPSVTVSF